MMIEGSAARVLPEDEAPRRPEATDESLVQFIRDNQGRIKKFLQRACDDPGLVEDAFQEALIVAYAHWDVVKHHERPLLWVHKTAWYKLLGLLRSRRLEVVGPDEADTAPLADPSNQWEAEFILGQLLRRLPTRQRAALALAADGCTDEEICQQLGLALTTVRTYKSAARRKLKELAEGASYLDDLLALTAQQIPTQLDEARARRTADHIEREYAERLAANVDISSDVDLRDPAAMAESKRILRSAELLKLGTISWFRTGPRIDWSAEMSRILGHAPGEVPPSLSRLVSMINPKDRATVRRQFRTAWRDEEEKEVGFRVVKPDGVTAYVHCSIEVVTEDGKATGIIATGQDVTVVEKARQERARRVLRGGTVQENLIELDPVTGLLTRQRFADEVGRALRTGTGTLLVVSAPPYIRRSTDAGSGRDDRLSAAAAEVIRSVVGPADACGVLGRHEFGVLLPYTTVDTAKSRAEEILNRLRATRYLAATSRLDAFGGLVHYDYRTPIESIELLFDAETAWRQAKSQDAPLHVLRQPPSTAQRREIARAGILAAVEGSRFALYAQPLRDLELNQTTRHEILLRVLDDVGRPAPPSTFLELAEHVDEILAVDKWVINNALRLVGEGSQTSHYQVNISGRSLADPLLIEHIRDAVARHRVNPERLTIEITETAAIGNLTIARRFADGVRALGCQLALDDFGTGNTPLSFLTQLPVDLVKIDGSFVQDLPRSKALQAVVEGLVQTCHRLGILTAAEYVQDDATLDLLRGYGVDFAQGYHVGEPELIVVSRRTAPSIELELFPAQERAAR